MCHELIDVLPGDSGIWFSREPEDVIVVAGSSAILHCVAATSDPNATPVILWRDRDNQIIDFRSETHMCVDSNWFPIICLESRNDIKIARLIY